jgi:hypothetical protein
MVSSSKASSIALLVVPAIAAVSALLAVPRCSVPDEAVAVAVAPGNVAAAASSRPVDYDPIAVARASRGKLQNLEAAIPPQCYTKTDGVSNPCWTCHTEPSSSLGKADWPLQSEYAFSEFAQNNHYKNLFVDRTTRARAISDDAVLKWVRHDNYEPLRAALRRLENYKGYIPDLEFGRGFDSEGFAADGSSWRALRYKPFPGVFWPTNGSTDDVMVRLPRAFRERGGKPSREVYKANLAVLEASFTTDPRTPVTELAITTEPLDERALGVDLDGDHRLTTTSRMVGLPSHYFGDAVGVAVRRNLYPQGTEFLHSVRYIDPDAPSLLAIRMKELRYSRKFAEMADWQISRQHAKEAEEKEEGKLPVYQGQPEVGLISRFGWSYQGYIEDAEGRLRLQTHEEHAACMGCHSGIGVTVDQSFAFPRKLPGASGYGHQDLRGMPDAPQLGHDEPEFLTYLRRVGAGDEFRQNEELIRRFVSNGKVNASEVMRAAPGGDKDLAYLVAPSRERALLLDKTYWVLMREQRFEAGRDVVLAPTANVHERVENAPTGLAERNRVYRDGQLRLNWSESTLVMR